MAAMVAMAAVADAADAVVTAAAVVETAGKEYFATGIRKGADNGALLSFDLVKCRRKKRRGIIPARTAFDCCSSRTPER